MVSVFTNGQRVQSDLSALAVPLGWVKSRGAGAGLRASARAPPEPSFVLTSDVCYRLVLDLQDECRSQELPQLREVNTEGVLERVLWRECRGNLCTGGERAVLKYLLSVAGAGSCSSPARFWLTGAALPQPCLGHRFFSVGFVQKPPASDKIYIYKKSSSRGGAGNQMSWFFSRLSFIYCRWMKWCFGVSQPYGRAAPRCPECVPWSTPKKRRALYPTPAPGCPSQRRRQKLHSF